MSDRLTNFEAHQAMINVMKKARPPKEEQNTVYLGAIALYLARIADSLDELARKETKCEENETNTSNTSAT